MKDDNISQQVKQTILVVDDHQENINLLQIYLSEKGYEVESAVNGFDALEKMARNDISLVITDISMPVMCGNELCRSIQETSAGLPIIAVSSDPYSAVAPFDGVFTKPFRADNLCMVVDELISAKVETEKLLLRRSIKK